MSGWVGGIGGCGARHLSLDRWAARRARLGGACVVIGLLMTILITGGTLLLMGLVSVASPPQPYHVYYPLLLCGVIATLRPADDAAAD